MRVSLDIQRDASSEPQFEQKTHILTFGHVMNRDGSTRFAYRERHSTIGASTQTFSFGGRSWPTHVVPTGDVTGMAVPGMPRDARVAGYSEGRLSRAPVRAEDTCFAYRGRH